MRWIYREKNEHIPLLVLNFGLDIVDRVGRLNLKRDGLPSQSLDKDLHTSAKTEH